MGYQHINNLYKSQDILLFKECYALEKVHGTSAHIMWRDGRVIFSGGSSKHKTFVALFDENKLREAFIEMGHEKVDVYGEAHGGKLLGMSETYGKQIKFVAFEIKIGDNWLSVPQAEDVVKKLGLEFVFYEKIPATVDAINAAMNRPSTQAKRNGVIGDKTSEGVVLRPLIELTKNNGDRIITKHKHKDFAEYVTVKEISPERLAILTEAEAIATEWVTPMRLQHVLGKLFPNEEAFDITSTPKVIKAMLEDVLREAKGEIIETPEAKRAISTAAAKMFKKQVTMVVQNEEN